jgi:O-antigen/teichoic acid export membrane protein
MVLNPIWLIIPILINTGLPYLFRRRNYKKNHAVEIKKTKYRKYFFHSGKHIVFSSLSVVLYTQCQSFFIFNFCGSAELGIYSVSVTLATGFGVLIMH